MPAHSELLTPAEAAVLAGVSVRDVHRVIDEHIVPARATSLEGGRRIAADACAYVRFYFETASMLTAPERTRLIHMVYEEKPRRRRIDHEFLTIDFDRFFTKTAARHADLKRARARIVEHPYILGGAPVVRGTRVLAHDIAAAVAEGADHDQVKAAYPGLEDDDIDLAVIYAAANPTRGRPRISEAPRTAGQLMSERKIPRRPQP